LINFIGTIKGANIQGIIIPNFSGTTIETAI